MADDQPGATPEQPADAQTPADDFKSEESKRSVLADLATERQARKELEGKFSRLAEALGGNPKAKDADLAEMVSNLTQRLEVSELAREHRITDRDDLAALLAVTNVDARAKLAARLAPSVADDKPAEVFPRPKPDASQGPKGDPAKPEPEPGLGRMRAAYAESSKN